MTSDVHDYYETYWSDAGYYPRGGLAPEVRRLLDEQVPPHARCLDVGCGDGRTAGLYLRERGCEYVGVDISANAVRDANAIGLDARQIEDAAALPFADGTFDVALAIEALEHMFQPQRAVGEILRVLRPGGILLATVPNVAYWRRRADLALLGRWNPFGDDLSVSQPWRDPHIRFFSPRTLSGMLVASGYRPVLTGGHGGAFLRDLPALRRLANGTASRPYRFAESLLPALLSARTHAVARKPFLGHER